MAQILRIYDGSIPESSIAHRVHKMESILKKSEKELELGELREKEGNAIASRILKKRAKHGARHAMSLMGILTIEYGVNVVGPAERARRVALYAKNGQNGQNGDAKTNAVNDNARNH
jgi:hypothetical protein